MEYILGSRANIKHCIAYLAPTLLFPVLVTSLFHIVIYTGYVAFGLISFLAMDAYTWDKWILKATFLLDFFKIIWESFH